MDIHTVRGQFPLLVNRQDVVYLDNAATTQKPESVLEAVRAYYTNTNSNVHRAAHQLSDEATSQFEDARTTVAKLVNAEHSREILWTRGTTESINLVAQAYGPVFCDGSTDIVITELEHHSNIVPWQMLCERTGARLLAARVLPSGELDMDHFRSLLSDRTRIVAVGHVSNALGTINPVDEIISMSHDCGAVVVVDGAQAIAHMEVDVQALDADFYAFSGHKAFAPTGIGVLYGKEALLDAATPWQGGGEMIEEVRIEKTTYQGLPFKFEAGTPNIAGAIGMAAAADFLRSLDSAAVHAHEQDLLTYATSSLNQIEGVRIVGEAKNKAPLVSFLLADFHHQDVGVLLDQQGVAVRTGHHCAMPLMRALGITGTVRASLGLYNSRSDIDRLVESVDKARSFV